MSHTSTKVHHSHGNVPFSWENKPGERKTATVDDDHKREEAEEDTLNFRHGDVAIKLPPPPYQNSNRKASIHDFKIPLPPSAFAIPPPTRSSSRRGLRREDDPFLMAYKECTKSSGKGNGSLRKNMSLMSCKKSCSVRDDSIVRISDHLPLSKSQRERSNRGD